MQQEKNQGQVRISQERNDGKSAAAAPVRCHLQAPSSEDCVLSNARGANIQQLNCYKYCYKSWKHTMKLLRKKGWHAGVQRSA